VLLHGAWIWVTLGLGAVATIFWRRLPVPGTGDGFHFSVQCDWSFSLSRVLAASNLSRIISRSNFSARPWRYVDVLAAPIAACAAIMLTLPGVFDRWVLGLLRYCLLGRCFGISGYCLVVRYYVYEDNTADYRQAVQASATWLEPYLHLDQIMDPDARGQFIEALGWPERRGLYRCQRDSWIYELTSGMHLDGRGSREALALTRRGPADQIEVPWRGRRLDPLLRWGPTTLALSFVAVVAFSAKGRRIPMNPEPSTEPEKLLDLVDVRNRLRHRHGPGLAYDPVSDERLPMPTSISEFNRQTSSSIIRSPAVHGRRTPRTV